MPKHKTRLTVGNDSAGNPISQWISWNTPQELYDRGCKASADPSTGKATSFTEYAIEWLDVFKRGKLKPTTLKTYESLMHKHILPFFEGVTLQKIKVGDMQKFFNHLAELDLSQSSATQMKRILTQIFSAAIEDKLITSNPATSKRIALPSKVKTREALSRKDYEDIQRNLPRLQPNDGLLLALFLFTGARRGEVLGLQWKDVQKDAETGRLFLSVSKNVVFPSNQPVTQTPKTEAGYRRIPVCEELAPWLTSPASPEVFLVGGGSEPITQSYFDRAFERIGKTIDLHGATPHTFRHTFATALNEAGVQPKTMQTILGHKDINTTMNRYTHGTLESSIGAIDAFSRENRGAFAQSLLTA